MPRAKSAVTQSELTSCAKAARAAGRNGMVIVKPDGTTVFVFSDSVSDTDVEIDDIDAMIEKVPDPMKRRRNPFPGVYTTEDRHGKLRHRLRRKISGHTIDTYLPGPYGSPESRQAYEEAIEGAQGATLRTQPGTIAYVIATYPESTAFRNLSPTTRRDKARRLDWIREAVGGARYAAIQPRHVEALMAKKGGPVAGNRVKKDLRQLFAFAAKHHGFRARTRPR